MVKFSLSKELLVLEEMDKTRKSDQSMSSQAATKTFSASLPKCGLKKQTLRPGGDSLVTEVTVILCDYINVIQSLTKNK